MENQLDLPTLNHGALCARNAPRFTSDGCTWRAVGGIKRGWLVMAQLPDSTRSEVVYPVNSRKEPIYFASLDTVAAWLSEHAETDEFEVLIS